MTWTLIANIRGPQGNKGEQGTPGQGFGTNAVEFIADSPETDWDVALGYRDDTGAARILIGRRKDGTWYPEEFGGTGGGTGTTPIVRWGDSLTANSESSAAQLSALLNNRTVVTQGIGGQTSQAIAARNGGVPTRVTVTGGVIPASGSVTMRLTVRLRSDLTGSTPLVVAGVAGTFVATDSSDYLTGTFTRTKAGMPAVVPNGEPAQTGYDYRDMWPIYWYGRNNFKQTDTVGRTDFPERIVADIRGSLEWNNCRDRALVLSIPPWVGEESGKGIRAKLDEANAALRDAFPREYVDTAARLRNADVIRATGNTPTDQDLADISNGLTPTVFRLHNSDGSVDAGHFGSVGYQALYMVIAEIYAARGWN
ncbi:hypothetical protein [Curtobacterium sp. MCSS17_015]|uniref:hypothetical protein n=1 Tax=Curtobacterium sp. MCSS17_015 TaxID=2175666 RepID=UPI0011B3B5E2|nr:hypothetical protein [Curtobacterium sp. MCSS17_015]WIB25436.1 hypothetical protein DEJ18_10240 [Curtobacterium sp. MCSS17_015]